MVPCPCKGDCPGRTDISMGGDFCFFFHFLLYMFMLFCWNLCVFLVVCWVFVGRFLGGLCL